MKSSWYAAGVVMALAAGLVAAPNALAKPGDLPIQSGIECGDDGDSPAKKKFTIELGLGTNGLILRFGVDAAKPTSAPISIDALMPAFLDQVFSHLGDMLARPDRFISVDALLRMMPQARSDDGKASATRATTEMRLFEPVNVKIKNVPLKQAIKNLAHASGVRIVPDMAALNDANVNMDFPVSLAVENTSLYTAMQQLLQPLKLTFEVENGVVVVTTPEKYSGGSKELRIQRTKTEAAQRLFEMAERHRRAGDYDLARTLYQQVHLLAPTSLHGRVAISRIVEVEERMRETTEEQDIPGRTDDPEQVFRDIRNRTVPLGLVEVSY